MSEKTPWITRFGTLVDVTERQGRKGAFITFKLEAKDFVQYGACFDADTIAKMKAAVGEQVWMKGPLDTHAGQDGTPPRKSFKVVYFKVTADGDTSSELEAAA